MKIVTTGFSIKGYSLALGLFFLISGCNEKEETQMPEQKKNSEKVEEVAEVAVPPVKSKPGEGGVEIHPIQEEKNAIRTVAIKKHFDKSFSDTTWYELIKDLKVNGEKLLIETALSPDEDKQEELKQAASAAWEFVNRKESEFKLKTVVYFDKNGQMLFYETNPSQS